MSMRLARAWAGGLVFFGWAASWAAPAPDVSAREVVERLRRDAVFQREPGDPWQAVAVALPLRLRCATPVAVALRQERLSFPPAERAGVDRLLTPPGASRRLATFESLDLRSAVPLPPDLPDDNANGVPDAFDRALEEGSRALHTWTETLGWLPPASGGASGGTVRIILADLPAELDSVALPDGEPERTFEEDATASLLVSRRLLDRPEELARAIVHQLAHAVLWAYSYREDPAWQEASAVALEIEARNDPRPYLEAFNDRLNQRAASLRADRLRLAQGAGLWALFLDLSRPGAGPNLRRVWEELAAVPGDNLTEAAETLLAAPGGADAGTEIATYLAWGLYTGDHADGRHFPFGAALDTTGPDATVSAYPADGASATALPPWSGTVVRFESGHGPGGLRLEMQGEERGRWSVLALFEGREDGGLTSTLVPVDTGGRASLRFPWRSVASLTLIAVNAAAPGTAPARFSYSASHDPLYPFDLTGFTAEGTADGVVLSWSTDGETDLAGWTLYRSLSPLRDFERVNRLPVPAAGSASEPLHYVFLDSGVSSGRKYYYYLEGLTTGGFAERTPGISARVPAPGRKR